MTSADLNRTDSFGGPPGRTPPGCAAALASDYIDRVRALPSLPQLVLELQAAMQQDDIDIHTLAERITLDAALAARVLRLANSSFYGVSSKVMTVQQAVSILGFDSIRTLVTACSIIGSFAPHRDAGFDLVGFWRHATATAVCARVLAPYMQLNPEHAFIAGLLHDIGRLVIATQCHEHYLQVARFARDNDCGLLFAENAVLGIDHARIGSALAAHWHFPALIGAAVAGHHQCAAQPPLTALIGLANALAHVVDAPGGPLAPLSCALPFMIPVPEDDWDRVRGDMVTLFGALCQVLTP
jgi:HD-like signal output (HDOD) protein